MSYEPMLREDATGAFLPIEYSQDLVVQPVTTGSVAYQATTNITTSSQTFLMPVVGEDAAADWVSEGAEIVPSNAVFGEASVTPAKVAGLSVISRELAMDSTPSAQKVVGDGLARSIIRKVDEAFFGKRAEGSKAPFGLEDVPGVNSVAAPAAWSDLDPFAQAISDAQQVGASVSSFVANPADALALANLKDQVDSNRPLLTPDPTQPTRHLIQGVPLLVSPAVESGTVWGIPRDLTFTVTREGTELAVDHSAFFTSDQVAIRAVMRVGFLFPHGEAIQKIVLAAE